MNLFAYTWIKLIFLLILFASCRSDAQQSGSSNTDASDENKTSVSQGSLSAETIPNGRRLTDDAISSYFPEKFVGLDISGKPTIKEIKNVEKNNNWVQQSYFKDGASSQIKISDWADDPKVLNQFNKGQPAEDIDDGFQTVKNYTSPEGLMVMETEQFRDAAGKKMRSMSQVILKNARFTIILNHSPKLEGEAVSAKALLKSFADSNLPGLFKLAIPAIDEEAIKAEEATTYIVLNCDALLPLETVRSICGVDIKLITDSFEKENNCSRTYRHTGSSASVVFLITQYSRSSVSRSAVDSQGKAKEEGDIEGLGDSAHLEVAGAGDYFLTVAYKNYLIELRSFKDRYDEKACCVCFSKEKLITMARGILLKLDSLH